MAEKKNTFTTLAGGIKPAAPVNQNSARYVLTNKANTNTCSVCQSSLTDRMIFGLQTARDTAGSIHIHFKEKCCNVQ